MRTLAMLALTALAIPVRIAAPTSPALAGSAGSASAVRYALPVLAPAVIVAPFRAPAGRFGPGHRGVDLATPRGGPVRAAADGIVRFAGSVAGRGVVVLAHADGLTTEYEPLRPAVRIGQVVPRGAVLGSVFGAHGTCAPDRCVHWAARRGAEYLDPMTLLSPLGEVRLLPWSPSAPPS